MRKHGRLTPQAVSAVCLMGLAITILPGAFTTPFNSRAHAAPEDCAASPKPAAPSGMHWWYRTDRATKRKCWFLGPQDKDAAARKANERDQAAATPRPAGDDAAEPAAAQETAEPVQDTPPAPLAHNQANGIPPFAMVTQEDIPFLVDWSELLQEAGIVSREDKTLTQWADDTAARMRDASVREPVAPHAAADQAGNDASAPQPAAADASHGATRDAAGSLTATPAQMPLTFIAALLIVVGICLMIVKIVRAQRQQNFQRAADAPVPGSYDSLLPAFLQREARPLPVGQGWDQIDEAQDQADDQDYGRGYGGEAELRRILEGRQRRAA